MIVIIAFICAFVVSYALTFGLRCYALKHNVLDIPEHRSSHTSPTPRGGGIAIVIATLGGLLLLAAVSIIAFNDVYPLLCAGALTAVLGFTDDHKSLPAKWRLLFHFLAAMLGLLFLGSLPAIDIFGYQLHDGWLGWIFILFYLVWMLNLYNFMDGINGLAGSQTVSFSVLTGIILWFVHPESRGGAQILILSLLAGGALGFLLWNFPKAKIFMGDAGSGFLGITLGLIALVLAKIDTKMFFVGLTLLGVFIVDATLTLMRRFFAGKRVYEAHSSHAFQILSRKLNSHTKVTLLVLAINIFWLFPIGFAIALGKIKGIYGLALAWFPLFLIAWFLGAGIKNKKEFLS